jgi:hypothetical protein
MNGIIYHTYTSCHKRIHLDLVYLCYTSIEKHNENKPYLLVDEHGGRKYRHDFRHNNAYSRILLSIACSFQNNHVLMILWNYSSDRAGIQNSQEDYSRLQLWHSHRHLGCTIWRWYILYRPNKDHQMADHKHHTYHRSVPTGSSIKKKVLFQIIIFHSNSRLKNK